MSVLQTIAIGRLTDDPIYKEVGNDKTPLCRFSLAVNIGFGEKQTTEYVDCTAWRNLAKIIAEHCKKGRKVFISGTPRRHSYTTEKDGVSFTRYDWSVEVKEFEFCDNAGRTERATTTDESYVAAGVGVEEEPF